MYKTYTLDVTLIIIPLLILAFASIASQSAMKRFILACFFLKAVIASFVPSPQIAEQSPFQVQQGNTDHNLNDTQLLSKEPKTPLCGVDMRTNKYADKCDNLHKDMFVCKIKEDGTQDCGKFPTPLKESEEYADHDCDHILDLQVFAKALDDAGLCEDITLIRQTYGKTSPLAENKVYLNNIKIAATNVDYLNYLDRRVHTIKTQIIALALGTRKTKIGKPKEQWKSEFLKMYYEQSFKKHGLSAAQQYDKEALISLTKMVDAITDSNQQSLAREYVNKKWQLQNSVEKAYEKAFVEWKKLVDSWL